MLLKTLLKNLIANLNSLIWKPHTTTDIICWWWYKALDENDLRYLLKKKRKLILYPQSKLMAAFDKISLEYNTITENTNIELYYREINEESRNVNNYNYLNAIYYLLILKDERVKEHLSYLGIKPEINNETIDLVLSKIRAIQTNAKIKQIKNKKETTKKVNFERRLLDLQYFLERNIDVKKTSLREWGEWENIAREKNEKIIELNSKNNARED